MAGYGAVVRLLQGMRSLLIAIRFIDEYFSLFAARTIFRYIYFCHYRTTMTSETSENAIFVRLYFAQCYLMQSAQNMKSQRNVSKNITLALCGWFVGDVIAATLVDQNKNEKQRSLISFFCYRSPSCSGNKLDKRSIRLKKEHKMWPPLLSLVSKSKVSSPSRRPIRSWNQNCELFWAVLHHSSRKVSTLALVSLTTI